MLGDLFGLFLGHPHFSPPLEHDLSIVGDGEGILKAILCAHLTDGLSHMSQIDLLPQEMHVLEEQLHVLNGLEEGAH